MSALTAEDSNKVVPAHLGFLAIYNPSLGTTDETLENQIVYYSSSTARERKQPDVSDPQAAHNAIREQSNEQLRQIGLAQGMVEFGRSFSDGRAVDTVETEKSRIILHELELGWWVLASINLTVLPPATNQGTSKGKASDLPEYSSRELKPALLLLGDILRAHSTFLLHHASSMSALFVRARRSKFIGLLGSYWDTFLSTWNVLMHGNPANSLYCGIKVAACGELGMGVGEEERGSGERAVLEDFVGRITGLVDIVVSKFGAEESVATGKKNTPMPVEPWLGSGNEPAAADGAIFLGTGALSRKSLRDVSHWVEDLHRWGSYAYGVIDNPTSNRRSKKTEKGGTARRKGAAPDPRTIFSDASTKPRQSHSLLLRSKQLPQQSHDQEGLIGVPPTAINRRSQSPTSPSLSTRPSLRRRPSSYTSLDNESVKGSKFINFLKLGYGTHWSLGGASFTREDNSIPHLEGMSSVGVFSTTRKPPLQVDKASINSSRIDSTGHYLIGLMGDIDSEDEEGFAAEQGDGSTSHGDNSRVLLRTVTVELEREEDARAEADISIDLGSTNKESSSKHTGSEHTGTSNMSFDSQDRNKTKKLRVVVYVSRPFIFVFLFELRTDALAFTSLYQSLHKQISSLIEPLTSSTSFRVSRPEIGATDTSTSPIYDLVFHPKLLTVNSTVPNIPDPSQPHQDIPESQVWSRIEALNTHMQIINTYIAGSSDSMEMERTCKTSRGWWVVWTRIPDIEPPPPSRPFGLLNIPALISEDGAESPNSTSRTSPTRSFLPGRAASKGTSSFGASMYSGAAHPYLETTMDENVPRYKEIFLIRRASDYVTAKPRRFASAASESESSWTSGPGRLAQGIGVDTKRYIEALLNLS